MIRFGSRGSKLALAQTNLIANELHARTGEPFEIEVISTRGDQNLEKPIAEIGGKGLFTAELEAALRSSRIDVAVHSLKDLPVDPPAGLDVGAVPPRVAPHDVLVFRPDVRDPEGGTVPLLGGRSVGTSSPRRCSSLLTLRPDLRPADIRGNIDSRARKVADGDYDATILAAAGLSRLGLETPDLERVDLPTDLFTPAPGQGALGIQCRAGDERILALLASIHDEVTAACVNAERELLFRLGGGCSMPLGALVTREDDGFRMQVSLFSAVRPACGIRLDLRADDATELAPRAAAQLEALGGEPLTGLRLALLRPADSGPALSRALEYAGATVELVSVSEIQPIHATEFDTHLDAARAIAFSSARAVDRFFEQLAGSSGKLEHLPCYAVGPATAAALSTRGITCTTPAAGNGSAALATLVQRERAADAGPILFPCAENRHPDFERCLQESGHTVLTLPVYRTVTRDDVQIPEVDHVVFTSPSAARAVADASPELGNASRLALGATTAHAMRSVDLAPHAVADTPTATALVQTIQGLTR